MALNTKDVDDGSFHKDHLCTCPVHPPPLDENSNIDDLFPGLRKHRHSTCLALAILPELITV